MTRYILFAFYSNKYKYKIRNLLVINKRKKNTGRILNYLLVLPLERVTRVVDTGALLRRLLGGFKDSSDPS
jgi:hypothetical protein